jgi:hypothetical protein
MQIVKILKKEPLNAARDAPLTLKPSIVLVNGETLEEVI